MQPNTFRRTPLFVVAVLVLGERSAAQTPDGTAPRFEVASVRPAVERLIMPNKMGLIGRRIVDETGLIGPYEFEMTFDPATFFSWMPRSPGTTDGLAPFASALREELGLTTDTERREVLRLVVINAEMPTPN
jgi:hypothetical protein